MANRTWLEVAVNGPWGRQRQPRIPIAVEDIVAEAVACAHAGAAAARGGHVRVGLEDAPFGSTKSNLDWVRAARREIEAAGSSLASAADVRRALDAR